MKHYLLLCLVLVVLFFSACKQQGNNIVTYPFQEGRALVGVSNDKGETAYMIINTNKEVVSYIHTADIELDTIYRNGRLSFTHIPTGQSGFFDLDGKEVWITSANTTSDASLQNQQPESKKETVPVSIKTNNWQEVVAQSPFYEEAKKTFEGGLEETDKATRQMILDYVERLRESYSLKDINFIEQVFSDHALIITGKVILENSSENSQYLPQEKVIYNLRNKQQYISKLRQVFAANKKIELFFSDFKINRHPTIPTVYGVSLRQTYTSDIYSDDGYLFLLWDFQQADAPQIHVRTWQPRILDDQTVIPENEIFSLRNFNLK